MEDMDFSRQYRINWLAGFIDGEGCFSLQCYVDKRGKKNTLTIKPIFTVLQAEKNKRGIEYVEDILKENNIKYNRYDNNGVCDVRVSNSNVKDLVSLLGPYLKVKDGVANHIIKYWDLKQKIKAIGNKYTGKNYKIDWDRVNKFCAWVDEFRTFNSTRNHKWTGEKIITFYKDLIRNSEAKNE